MRRLFITGGTGFIGRHLIQRLLSEGYELTLLIKKGESKDLHQCHVFEYDYEINHLIDHFNICTYDAVIHLASLYINQHQTSQVDDLLHSNIQLGTHILEAMSKTGIKHFINTSSFTQHYDSTCDYHPVSLYAATKQAFEDIILFYTETFNMNALTLMLYDTYGKNDTRPKLINLLVDAANNGKILDMSPGLQEINYSYIDDIMEAYVLGLDYVSIHEGFHRYAVRSSETYSIQEIVQVVEEVLGKKIETNFGALPYRNREIMKITTEVPILPGYYPKYTLRDGLKDLLGIGEVDE